MFLNQLKYCKCCCLVPNFIFTEYMSTSIKKIKLFNNWGSAGSTEIKLVKALGIKYYQCLKIERNLLA